MIWCLFRRLASLHPLFHMGPVKLNIAAYSGDVKYHMGYGSEVETLDGKQIHLKLMPNPSHLEAVDPVVVGFSRAKADVLYKSDYDKIREDDQIDIKGLTNFTPGQQLTIVLHHSDGRSEEFKVNQSYNENQIEWFKAGGALNIIRSQIA